MKQEQKEQLLQQFSEYLDTLPEQSDPPVQDDTFGLHAELAGLKNEVHIESRQLKQALDDFRAVFASLEQANRQLELQLTDVQLREEQAARDAVKPLLASLVDLYDRLNEAVEVSPPRKTFLSFRFERRLGQWIKAQRAGMKMLRQRLADITETYGLQQIQCTGKPFTAEYMQAVGTGHEPALEEGVVLSEVRTGFFLNGEPLRLAEVIVNRRHTNMTELNNDD